MVVVAFIIVENAQIVGRRISDDEIFKKERKRKRAIKEMETREAAPAVGARRPAGSACRSRSPSSGPERIPIETVVASIRSAWSH